MKLDIIIPCFNEEKCLLNTISSIAKLKFPDTISVNIIIVDDGSEDGTWNLCRALYKKHLNINAYRCAKNYGKELAILTGILKSSSDAFVVIDADGQHPVNQILEFIKVWREHKFNCFVIGEKNNISTEPSWRKIVSSFFAFFYSFLSGEEYRRATDFILFDNRFKKDLLARRKRYSVFRFLVKDLGIPCEYIPISIEKTSRKSKFNLPSLLKLAIQILVGHTKIYRRFLSFSIIGSLLIFSFFILKVFFDYYSGVAFSGYPTLFVFLSLNLIITFLTLTSIVYENLINTKFDYDSAAILIDQLEIKYQ